MAVNNVAECSLGGFTQNVQTGNHIHFSSAAAVSDAKRNHLFERSVPSRKRKHNDMQTNGIFLQFHPEIQRALLEVGMKGN
jgi:hypothetical protein